MTTLVTPDVSALTPPVTPEAGALDLDALAASELQALDAFYTKHKRALTPPIAKEKFVELCLKRHLPLIRHWGAWSFEAPLDETFLPAETLQRELDLLLRRWRAGAQLKQKTFAPIPFRQHTNEFEAMYCELEGCHLPQPNLEGPWSFKIAKEAGELAVAHGLSVTVRKGQAVSRAVLTTIRRRYADKPEYIAFWEAWFEQLGVLWAAQRPYKVVLSTAPSAFLRLGTIGENSCYRIGGEWEQAKLHIAQIPNSIAVFVYAEGDDMAKARCWGVVAPKAGGAELTNFYMLPRQQMLPGIRDALVRALELDKPLVEFPKKSHVLMDMLHNDTHAYVNGDHILVARDHNPDEVLQEINEAVRLYRKNFHRVENPDEGLDDERSCNNCGGGYGEPRQCLRCGDEMCSDCGVYPNNDDYAQCYCASDCAAAAGIPQCAGCENFTTEFEMCPITEKKFCRNCAGEKLLECARCHRQVAAAVRTVCGRCQERRCDTCKKEDESTTRGAHCHTCQQVKEEQLQEEKQIVLKEDTTLISPTGRILSWDGWNDVAWTNDPFHNPRRRNV